MSASFWLFKTEPDTYSFEQLISDRKTNWNGVRNYQARNYLNEAKKGDLVLIYHSGQSRSVVGIAEVIRTAYSDPDPERPGDWVQVDIQALKKLQRSVELAEIKTTSALRNLPLLKQSRLSVMPILKTHFLKILQLGQTSY